MPFDFEESRADATGKRLGLRRLDIEELLARVLWLVRAKVAAGDWSVRGLARELGWSQPYLHNVVRGHRPMTAALADVLLRHFRVSVFDLISPGEYEAWALDRAETDAGLVAS